jgi:AcrR family transcriptional regulator
MTNQGEKLETRILDAAERLFAKDGVAATGMRAIATSAKASIGAVYHHFKSKEDILESIVRQELEERQRFLEGLRSQGLPLEAQIEQIVQMHFTLLQERSDAARLFFRERFDPHPALQTKIQALYDEVAEYVAEILTKGIATGEVRPCHPYLTAYAILGMVESVSLRALNGDETAALFMKEGPKELSRSLWFWLGSEEKKGSAHA